MMISPLPMRMLRNNDKMDRVAIPTLASGIRTAWRGTDGVERVRTTRRKPSRPVVGRATIQGSYLRSNGTSTATPARMRDDPERVPRRWRTWRRRRRAAARRDPAPRIVLRVEQLFMRRRRRRRPRKQRPPLRRQRVRAVGGGRRRSHARRGRIGGRRRAAAVLVAVGGGGGRRALVVVVVVREQRRARRGVLVMTCLIRSKSINNNE